MLEKLLPIIKLGIGIFKKKVETDGELQKEKFAYGHKWLMVIGTALALTIVADNIFKLGVGSYVYDMFQLILEYFMS